AFGATQTRRLTRSAGRERNSYDVQACLWQIAIVYVAAVLITIFDLVNKLKRLPICQPEFERARYSLNPNTEGPALGRVRLFLARVGCRRGGAGCIRTLALRRIRTGGGRNTP